MYNIQDDMDIDNEQVKVWFLVLIQSIDYCFEDRSFWLWLRSALVKLERI